MHCHLWLWIGLSATASVALAQEQLQAWSPRSEESRAQLREDPVCRAFDAEELAELIAAGEVRKGMRETDVLAALG